MFAQVKARTLIEENKQHKQKCEALEEKLASLQQEHVAVQQQHEAVQQQNEDLQQQLEALAQDSSKSGLLAEQLNKAQQTEKLLRIELEELQQSMEVGVELSRARMLSLRLICLQCKVFFVQ